LMRIQDILQPEIDQLATDVALATSVQPLFGNVA
jgi:hypothetical protein